jgi:WD40 repeat protein
MTNCVIYVYKLDDPAAAPREIVGHAGAVLALAFLPDGKTLVSGGGRDGEWGEVKAWDFATGRQLGEFRGHRLWVEALAVSPDGRTVASGSWANGRPGELRVWDVGGLRPLATAAVPAELGSVTAGAVGPDGRLLVLGGSSKGVAVWDMTDPAKPTPKAILSGHSGAVTSVSFSRAGDRFVTADTSGTVTVWDAATLKPVVSFRAADHAVSRAKFTPDGRSVVTGSNGEPRPTPGELRVWDAASGKETGRFPDLPRGVLDFVFLDGGRLLLTTHASDDVPTPARLLAWDFEGRRPAPLPVPAGTTIHARSLDLSPDGSLLAVGATDGPVRVFDVATWREVVAAPDLRKPARRVAFAPDGRALAVAGDDTAAVVIRVPTK